MSTAQTFPSVNALTAPLIERLVADAGAVAVPLIIGRALKLSPEDVAFLISADLFVCGIVSIIQSLGATQWFGVRLPVMMGVTFAAVGPMVAIANETPGEIGARALTSDGSRKGSAKGDDVDAGISPDEAAAQVLAR